MRYPRAALELRHGRKLARGTYFCYSNFNEMLRPRRHDAMRGPPAQ